MINRLLLSLLLILLWLSTSFAASQDRLPTGDGVAEQWTGVGCTTDKWDCVNDPIGTPDDTSTYLTSTDTTYYQYFTFTAFDITSAATPNITVTVTSRCRWSGTGNGVTYTNRIRVNGTNYAGNTHTLSTSYANYSYSWATNPAGGAWTEADVEGTGAAPLQQFILKAGVVDAGEVVECTQDYITVDYTPLSTPMTIIQNSGEDWE